MKIEDQAETAVLEELGQRLSQARLDRNLTQEALAEAAGVSKRTVERLEGGQSVQMSNLTRVLRALDLLRNLDQLVPPAGPRPIQQLKHQGKTRRRASTSGDEESGTWSWDDDP